MYNIDFNFFRFIGYRYQSNEYVKTLLAFIRPPVLIVTFSAFKTTNVATVFDSSSRFDRLVEHYVANPKSFNNNRKSQKRQSQLAARRQIVSQTKIRHTMRFCGRDITVRLRDNVNSRDEWLKFVSAIAGRQPVPWSHVQSTAVHIFREFSLGYKKKKKKW